MDEDNPENEGTGSETDQHGLPHWTEPGTAEVRMAGALDDAGGWEEPRWREGANEAPASSGEVPTVYATGDASAEQQFFGYEEGDAGAVPIANTNPDPAPEAAVAEPRLVSSRPRPRRRPQAETAQRGQGPSNELLSRVGTGVGLAALAIIALFLGREATLVLIAGLLVMAASEFYMSMRQVGYEPATLLGLVTVGALPLAAFWRGEGAIPLILFLFILFGGLWYLLGVQETRPVPNLGVTALGVVWIGVLGSTAALLLDFIDFSASPAPVEHGRGLLLVAIILTAAYDIGGFFVGRAVGSSPLSEASPNKTVEGLLGGMATTILVSVVVVGVIGISPFDGDPFGTVDALFVGIAVALVAPLGDLFESMVKRDLNIKDMGSILPGHGGLLDRFDALLFALPATYYMVRILL